MEKLLLSGLIFYFSLLCSLGLFAQESGNYCVFQVDGQPMLNDSLVIKKGMLINKTHWLTLQENETLILTDSEGVLYEIPDKTKLSYNRIAQYSRKNDQSNFTITYLKFIWKKLRNRETKENIGVVFRAPLHTQAISPPDSAQLFTKEIRFSWETLAKGKMQHLYIKSPDTESTLKISSDGNRLALPVDLVSLKENHRYQWAVTHDENTALEDLTYRSFTLLDQSKFDQKMQGLKTLINEFERLGLSSGQIAQTLCEDQKLCFD
jgi:hypothetical protein